ncbi:hypothetical protein PAMA_019260 [Pampus argenteus]
MAKHWSATFLVTLALLSCLVGTEVEAQEWHKPAPHQMSKGSPLPQAPQPPKAPQYSHVPQVQPPPPPKAPQYSHVPQVRPPPPPKAPQYSHVPQVQPPPPPKAPQYSHVPQVQPPPPPKTPQYSHVPQVQPPPPPKSPQYSHVPQVQPPPPPKAPQYSHVPQVQPPPPPKAPQYSHVPQVQPPPPPKAPQYSHVPQVQPPPPQKAPQYSHVPQVRPPPPQKAPQYSHVPQVQPPPPPKAPQYSHVPQVQPPSPPKAPQYPNVPQVRPPSPPKAPQYPNVPQVRPPSPPKAPQYPNVPQVRPPSPPKAPQYPNVPQVRPPSPPKAPQYPNVPQVRPQFFQPPSQPKFPQYPGAPKFPGYPRAFQSPQDPEDPQKHQPQQPAQPHKTSDPNLHSCEVDHSQRIPCGSPDISAAACEAISCCFDGRQCYFGKSVTVQCTKDAQFIVVVARDATLPNIDLESISLLGEGHDCTHVDSNSNFAIYQFPVTACGSIVTEEPGVITYENRMTSSFEVGVGPYGIITRDSHYELLFQCRYIGTSVVTVVVEVLPLQDPPLPVAALGPIRVQLRLANGQCYTKGCNELDAAYSSFYTEADYPVTKVLRDPVYVEVQLMEKTDPMLVLTLGRCWTTTSPNPHSLPQWDILIDGCPYRDDRYLSSLVPVGSSSGLDFPSHYRRFLFKMFTFVEPSSLTPMKEQVYIHCSTAVCSAAAGHSCEPSCFRKRRDVVAVQKGEEPKVVVSVGPVIMAAPETE